MDEDYYDVRGLSPGDTYVLRVVSVDGKQESVSDAEEIRTYPIGKSLRHIMMPPDLTNRLI